MSDEQNTDPRAPAQPTPELDALIEDGWSTYLSGTGLRRGRVTVHRNGDLISVELSSPAHQAALVTLDQRQAVDDLLGCAVTDWVISYGAGS